MTDSIERDLHYTYPESLVALKPEEPCRVLFKNHKTPYENTELKLKQVKDVFEEGDLLVINNSGVKACRVFCGEEFKREVLFLSEVLSDSLPDTGHCVWEVLFKSKDFKVGDSFLMPGGVKATLLEKGRPQKLKLDEKIDSDYFNKHGQVALPPYIQKARESRSALEEDFKWYQLDWKKNQNSLAAPTASLHFKKHDLENISRDKNIDIAEISLDVGLGTFLPLEEKKFLENKLHSENYFIPQDTKEKILKTIENNKRVWALGTTALRAVESMSQNIEEERSSTQLFIKPGYEFKYVSGLLTNFHQPGSSLLLLMMAFFGVDETKKAYEYAVENKFRLFSYGDLSVWTRKKTQRM